VPHLDIVGTVDSANGAVALFVLNRDLENSRQFEINWESNTPGAVSQALVLTGDELKAVNGFDAPERVKPKAADKPSTGGGKTRIEVPAKSYSVIQWGGSR
jgi:alpha-N-arabinofuranosidase